MNVEPLITNPNEQKIDGLNDRLTKIEEEQSYMKKQIRNKDKDNRREHRKYQNMYDRLNERQDAFNGRLNILNSDTIDYGIKIDDICKYQIELEKKMSINKKLDIVLIAFTTISIILEIIIMAGGIK